MLSCSTSILKGLGVMSFPLASWEPPNNGSNSYSRAPSHLSKSCLKSSVDSLYLQTVHEVIIIPHDHESIGEGEYVAKFNVVALETPGVDAKIKIHTFIQGLRNGPFSTHW